MQPIDNVIGNAEKPKRKNNQCSAQIKTSVDTTWCFSQRALKAEKNNDQAWKY